jgi:hypothetical protein
MARRKSKGESALIGLVIISAALVWLIDKINDSIGLPAVAIVLIALFAVAIYAVIRKRAARLAYLRTKYGDETIVQRIIGKQCWQGQTAEQLLDSLGDAPSVDRDLLKTKKREVWKYGASGKGRYRLRITLDQDVVVGVKTIGQ